MWQILTLAIPFGLLLSLLVGPVFFLLIETSISKGMRAAIALDLGVLLSDSCYILLAFYSSKDLIEKIKGNPLLFVFGGLVLMGYGLTNIIQKGRIKHSNFRVKKVNYLKLIVKGFLINIINVGVFFFWLGILVVVHSQFNLDTSKTLLFFTFVLGVYFAIDLIKILLAEEVKKKLTLRRMIRIKQVIGLILMLFGAVFIARAFLPG